MGDFNKKWFAERALIYGDYLVGVGTHHSSYSYPGSYYHLTIVNKTTLEDVGVPIELAKRNAVDSLEIHNGIAYTVNTDHKDQNCDSCNPSGMPLYYLVAIDIEKNY